MTRCGGFFCDSIMPDITTLWSPALGHGDWSLLGQQLVAGNDLETAILISVFTDRTAAADDAIPDGTGDPRGWWADAGEDVPIGSRLWLMERSKRLPGTAQAVEDYIAEAVQWLIDDGVVARFDITAEWISLSTLGCRLVAIRQDGSRVALNFPWVWNGIS